MIAELPYFIDLYLWYIFYSRYIMSKCNNKQKSRRRRLTQHFHHSYIFGLICFIYILYICAICYWIEGNENN